MEGVTVYGYPPEYRVSEEGNLILFGKVPVLYKNTVAKLKIILDFN